MTIEQLATIMGIVGGIDVVSILSLLIAFFTYRHKVKKDAEDKIEADKKAAARAAAQFTKWDTDIGYIKDTVGELKSHDEQQSQAFHQYQLDLVRIETKVDAHINNKQIHYSKAPAMAAAKRRKC